ncbi:TonB-dependent receptor [Marinobacterium stanieri]|uniref:TonB-dependent receptor n=1 Tax=Marinobacterium stanieri TaxID=49186 RepID=UPI003A8DEE65
MPSPLLTFRKSLISVAIGLASTQALAAEADLNTTVITANRAATSIADIPATVRVIEAEQIQQQMRGGSDFKDALAQLIPSLDAGSQGRTNYGQYMRGRSILVMIDGVSLISSRSVSRQFESIDPFNIARIEVISGASSVYGGGGTGGVINIITRKGAPGEPRFDLETGVKSGFHSDDLDSQLAGAVSGGNDRMDYRISASLRKTGAFYNTDDEEILQDITQTSSQYGDQVDLMANTGIQLDDEQHLQLTAQYFKNEQDADRFSYFGPNYAGFTDPSQVSVEDGLQLDDQPETERKLLNLQYANDDLMGQQLLVQGFYRSEALQFYPFPRAASQTVSASNQETEVYGLKAVMVSQLSADTSLTYGADLSRETFDSRQQYYNFADAAASGGLVYNPDVSTGRYPGVEIDEMALFLQANSQVTDQLTLNGGLRYQYANAKIDDFVDTDQQYLVATGQLPYADAVPGGEADYNTTLFNLGAVYSLTPEHQLYANFSQGFEVPDPAKYYGYGNYDGSNLLSGINVADNKADALKTDSYELGWRYDDGQLRTQLSAYYSISDKRISNSSRNLSVSVLDEKKRIYGLEAIADYRINSNWALGANLHLVEPEKKGDGWQALEAYYASTHKLGAHVDWNQGPLNLRLQGMKVYDYKDDAGRELDGYTLFDLVGGYDLPVGNLSFGINNLFDTDYQTLWSQKAQMLYAGLTSPAVVTFEGRGRTLGLSYAVQF